MSQFLLEKLTCFYNVQENFNRMIEIVEKNKISLRIIEWYVTIYSKYKNKQIHINYKNKLKGLHKTNFDVYCRSTRNIITRDGKIQNNNVIIDFKCQSGVCKTTIAQLNFYKWIIENKVLEYIYNDYTNVYQEFKEYEYQKSLKRKLINS